MKPTEEKIFAQGYILAVVNLITMYDQPTMAEGVFKELGYTVEELRGLGIPAEDMHVIRKHIKPSQHGTDKE